MTPADVTLRDYFAAAALTGLLMRSESQDCDRVSEVAYMLADAMLEERVKPFEQEPVQDAIAKAVQP